MSDRDRLAELIDSCKRRQDELAVQIHLGSKEAKDEWEKLSARLDDLAKEYEPLKDAVEESASNVFTALKLVADEIGEGFDRISKKL